MILSLVSSYSTGIIIFFLIMAIWGLCMIQIISDKKLSNLQKFLWAIFVLTTPMGLLTYCGLKIFNLGKQLFRKRILLE
jgi:hypothetical protein